MKNYKKTLVQNKIFHYTLLPVYRFLKWIVRTPSDYFKYKKLKNNIIKSQNKQCIYYLGKPAHANLGDLAQGVCILRWLNKHFSNFNIIPIETEEIVNTHFSILKIIQNNYRPTDLLLFQSGYTTTDLGGDADKMHCKVIKAMPHAKMVMMPQTIFFKSSKRKENTSRIYNSALNMLYLARDTISFNTALQMFPDINVKLFPDIVTSLIGTRTFESKRDGVLFCCRDDEEKYYSDSDIDDLISKCSEFAKVRKTDTTKYVNIRDILKSPSLFVEEEIEKYSHFKCVITDRYHGTIFSLVANTPVIVIKTTDHKVITGAEWFKGIYDDYVFVADSLGDAYLKAKELIGENEFKNLAPYFEINYYDKLAIDVKEILNL